MSNISKEKIDNLILNYFIQEGYDEAARSFGKEIDVSLSSTTEPFAGTDDHFLNQLAPLDLISDIDFAQAADSYTFKELEAGGLSVSANDNFNSSSSIVEGYSTIKQRNEIKVLILKGEITRAIDKISENFPAVLDMNNLLHFKLLKLSLIEMIRSHKLNDITNDNNDSERQFLSDTLTFVRENLINKVTNSFKLLKELEITMSLLCFNFDPQKKIEEQKDLPDELRSLFDLSLRRQCYRLVNRSILDLDKDKECLGDNNHLSENKGYRISNFEEFDLEKLSQISSTYDDESNISEDMDVVKVESNKAANTSSVGGYVEKANPIPPIQHNREQFETPEDELDKLQDLSLESALERAVKLWAITEQRLVDLNVLPKKAFTMNDEYV